MTKAKRYRTWLWEQRDRDDPVGDLARDAWRDRKGWRGMTVASFRDRLVSCGACTEARRAFDDTILEWHDEQASRRVKVVDVAEPFRVEDKVVFDLDEDLIDSLLDLP